MGFESANIYFKVTLAVSILALITHIVGCATPNWIVNDASGWKGGLFYFCVNEDCVSYLGIPGKVLSVEQAMGAIGLILVLSSVIGSVLIVAVDSLRPGAYIVAVCFLIAGIAITICVILVGTEVRSPVKIGYSLGLSAAGGILSLITARLMFVGHCVAVKSVEKSSKEPV